MQLSTSVVPNRGAVKRYQGCRQILNLLPFNTTKGAQNCHFSQGKGAAKFFSALQGAVNQKRLKNTGLHASKVVNIDPESIILIPVKMVQRQTRYIVW